MNHLESSASFGELHVESSVTMTATAGIPMRLAPAGAEPHVIRFGNPRHDNPSQTQTLAAFNISRDGVPLSPRASCQTPQDQPRRHCVRPAVQFNQLLQHRAHRKHPAWTLRAQTYLHPEARPSTPPVQLAAAEGPGDEGGDSSRASRSRTMQVNTLAEGAADEAATKRDGAKAAQIETAEQVGQCDLWRKARRLPPACLTSRVCWPRP